MAGSYPDSPAPRLAYDTDGTVVFDVGITATTSAVLGTVSKAILNDETSNAISHAENNTDRAFVFLFPEAIDLVAYKIFAASTYATAITLKWVSATATNPTTNGLDGDWTTVGSLTTSGSVVSPNYRLAPASQALSNVKALRLDYNVANGFSTNVAFYGIHFYANPHTGTSRKLAFWDPTSDVEIGPAYFDAGNVTASSTATTQFRIKNLGALTASAIDLGVNVLTEGSPTVTSQNALSINNTTFATSIRLRNTGDTADLTLATNDISPILYFKRTTNASPTLGTYSGRLHATATFS
jgi:hypothetical protein